MSYKEVEEKQSQKHILNTPRRRTIQTESVDSDLG
jgi:hypothetical protein